MTLRIVTCAVKVAVDESVSDDDVKDVLVSTIRTKFNSPLKAKAYSVETTDQKIVADEGTLAEREQRLVAELGFSAEYEFTDRGVAVMKQVVP